MTVRVLYLPPTVAEGCDQMGRILFAEDVERFFEPVLLDQAVAR